MRVEQASNEPVARDLRVPVVHSGRQVRSIRGPYDFVGLYVFATGGPEGLDVLALDAAILRHRERPAAVFAHNVRVDVADHHEI